VASVTDIELGHRSLFQLGKILHRDISINNVMITESAQEGDPKGFLIDLDMASMADSETNSGALYRTGTLEFIAIGILDRTERHTYRHDLESFFYVLLWICIKYDSAGNRAKPGSAILEMWSSSPASAVKLHQISLGFDYILDSLADGFGDLRGMLRQLREAIFYPPAAGGNLFLRTPEGDHAPMYQGVIDAIDGQLRGGLFQGK
jgi:serine/threonine protein kinase